MRGIEACRTDRTAGGYPSGSHWWVEADQGSPTAEVSPGGDLD